METCELARVFGDVDAVVGILLRIQDGSLDEWGISDGSNTTVSFQGDGLGNVAIWVQEVRFEDG